MASWKRLALEHARPFGQYLAALRSRDAATETTTGSPTEADEPVTI